MATALVRCRDCDTFVHPVFDWCDDPGAYLCDECAQPYADPSHDTDPDHARTATHEPPCSTHTANVATD